MNPLAMNPLAKIFVPTKIRTDIPLQSLKHCYNNCTHVCQCMSRRCTDDNCNCNENYFFAICIYNGTIAVYDEDHSQFFYLEGDLSIRQVLAHLGYSGDDIAHIPYGLFGNNEDADDYVLDSPILTEKPNTIVALQ